MNDVLRGLTFEFLGSGGHKIAADAFLDIPDAVLLDVRTNEEVAVVSFSLKGMVSQSLHIPLNELPDRWGDVPGKGVVGILCVTDVRSAIAYAYLQSKGITNVRILAGGTAGLLAELKTGKVRKRLLAHQA